MSAFLEAFCGEAGVERSRYLRLNVVLEELFLNTVSHGHRGDCDAPVWITLEARPDAVQVTYEDGFTVKARTDGLEIVFIITLRVWDDAS